MDTNLLEIFSWQFVLFGLFIYGLTFILRKFGETILDKPQIPINKTDKIWSEFFLPVAPIANGALLGWLLKMFPFPEGIHSTSGRIIFGFVCGLASSWIYKVVRGLLKAKLPENLQNSIDE